MADWLKIKAEYISGCGSMRELAQKHGVSASALMKRAAIEHWADERKEQGRKIEAKVKQKTASKIASGEADRIMRLLAIGDSLSAKLEQAAAELGTVRTVKRKVTGKQKDAGGNDVYVEEAAERTVAEPSPIRAAELKQLASALRDLREAMCAMTNDSTQTVEDLTPLAKLLQLDADAGCKGTQGGDADA